MRLSTLFPVAIVAFSQIADVSAAANPTVMARQSSDKKGVQQPKGFPKTGAVVSQGCFSTGANFTQQKTPEFLSSGSCGDLCKEKKAPVMALHGAECLCGKFYPPEDALVKDSKCDFPCPGFDEEACGSLGQPGHWSVFNTGIKINVPNMEKEDDDEDSAKTSSTSSSSAASTAEETAPAATESKDKEEENEPEEEKKKDGPNTAGIAAGVVVGVAVIAGGIGGFFFWMRRRRNAEIEEDHRRNAAVNAFINGSKPPSSHGSISMTDSRLDPVMAHRRMSDGSIADNQDYSRRILRVRDDVPVLTDIR